MQENEVEKKELVQWKREIEDQLAPLEEQRNKILEEARRAGYRSAILHRAGLNEYSKYEEEILKRADEKWNEFRQFEEENRERLLPLRQILAAIDRRLTEMQNS